MARSPVVQGFRRAALVVSASLVTCVVAGIRAEDWPAFRHDGARSGVTSERLELPLARAWTYRSRVRPRMAWPAPAKWDGWNKVYDLKDRTTFDRALQVVSVGDAVYFGSSIDDKVFCVDAASGRQRWAHFTEGPVRFAPTIARDRVFVASDDGFVSCLRAEGGEVIWRQRAAPRLEDGSGPAGTIAGNGRMISRWPVRTGVVVVKDRAYCGAGVFPFEKVFVCAFDAATGAVLERVAMTDLTAQGYMLASPTRIYITTGRERPVVFSREPLSRLHQVEGGGGGTYALLSGDALLYGPGKSGEVSFHGPGKDQLASFRGNHMILTPERSYLHDDTSLSSLDRVRYLRISAERRALRRRREAAGKRFDALEKASRTASSEARELEAESKRLEAAIREKTRALGGCITWRASCDSPFDLILAGDTLFAGGAGKVDAHDASSGRLVWSAPVEGGAFGVAVANGRLFVSTDSGAIHCFESGGARVDSPGGHR